MLLKPMQSCLAVSANMEWNIMIATQVFMTVSDFSEIFSTIIQKIFERNSGFHVK